MSVLIFSLISLSFSLFNYRRKINIDNTDGDLSMEEVMVVINTYSYGSKIKNNCEDISFVSEDGVTLPYYREGPCKKYFVETTFWVLFDNLPSGQSSFYVYYGSDDGDTGNETPFEGNFVYLMDQSTCPEETTHMSSLTNGYYIKIESTSNINQKMDHEHEFLNGQCGPIEATFYLGSDEDTEHATIHSHIIQRMETPNLEIEPPGRSFRLCQSNYSYVPLNGVFPFFSTLPTGFSVMNDMVGKFPYIKSSNGETKGSETHFHEEVEIRVEYAEYAESIYASDGTDNECCNTDHIHRKGEGVSLSGSSIPFSFYAIYGISTKIDIFQNEMYVLSTAAIPYGWEAISIFDDSFLIGCDDTNDRAGNPYIESKNHNHEFFISTGSLDTKSCNLPIIGSDLILMGENHVHNCSGNLSYESTEPSYSSFALYQKKDSLTIEFDQKGEENYYECNSVPFDSENVCGGKGNCTSEDVCECIRGFIASSFCTEMYSMCGDYYENEELACFGNGKCKNSTCTCDSERYLAIDNCETRHSVCNSSYDYDNDVCNFRGNCTGDEQCECERGYKEDTFCSTLYNKCYGLYENEGACSGEPNICHSNGTCECSNGYSNDQCTSWSCNDIDKDNNRVCNERGTCERYNECGCDNLECPTDYLECIYGQYCAEKILSAELVNKMEIVVEYSFIEHEMTVSDGKATIDCSSIINDNPSSLGISECYFSLTYEKIDELHLILSESILKEGDILSLLTGNGVIVNRTLEKGYVDDDDDDDDYDDKKGDEPSYLAYYITGAVGGVFLLSIILIILIFVIIVLLISISRYQKKKKKL